MAILRVWHGFWLDVLQGHPVMRVVMWQVLRISSWLNQTLSVTCHTLTGASWLYCKHCLFNGAQPDCSAPQTIGQATRCDSMPKVKIHAQQEVCKPAILQADLCRHVPKDIRSKRLIYPTGRSVGTAPRPFCCILSKFSCFCLFLLYHLQNLFCSCPCLFVCFVHLNNKLRVFIEDDALPRCLKRQYMFLLIIDCMLS